VTAPPATLEELLRVEAVGEDVFGKRLDSFGGTSFGGQILGCTALAAGRTCEDRALHALHACFLRPIPPEQPIELRVERLSEGRRLARRRVAIRAGDRLAFELVASFAAPGDGPELQEADADGSVPPPEELPTAEAVAREEGWSDWRESWLEWRWVGRPWRPTSEDEASRHRGWVRPSQALPDDRALHAAAVAFLSDVLSHWPVARRLGAYFEPVGFASLDTVVWLHRDLPWDDWRLVTSENDVAHAGRALSRRTLHTRDGRLVASMAQEALIPSAPPPTETE
jgi:acyl-CoA thioesterase-2